MANTSTPLTPVAEIKLDGEVYRIAKNGGYCLTKSAGKDPFGTEYYRTVDPIDYLGLLNAGLESDELRGGRGRAQDLIDALGEALSSLQQARDLRQGKKE